MAEETSELKKWGLSLLIMIILFFGAWVIGLVIIWVSRIILSPNQLLKPPPIRNSIFVGLAVIFTYITWFHHPEDYNNPPVASDEYVEWKIDVTGPNVTFREPPKKDAKLEALFKDELLGPKKNQTVYVLGPIDGRNRKFKLSMNPKKFEECVNNTWGVHGENLFLTMTDPDFGSEWAQGVRKYKLQEDIDNLFPITAFLIFCGVIAFIHAHLPEERQ